MNLALIHVLLYATLLLFLFTLVVIIIITELMSWEIIHYRYVRRTTRICFIIVPLLYFYNNNIQPFMHMYVCVYVTYTYK